MESSMHNPDNAVTTECNRFKDLKFDLLTQNNILKDQQSQIDASYTGDGEYKTVWMMESWSAVDSLKRLENKLVVDRDELKQLDQSIVSLYMKILAYQTSKVSSMMKRLEYLRHKDATQPCPIDYTVQSYQEWTRTNPKIHALQSEVLELLGRKIKYRNQAMEKENIKTLTLKDFADTTVERLRSQTLFFLEKDPLVDADFSLHVSSVADIEANTFEAERMRNFISYCWENRFAEDLGQTYQEFVGALVEHIMNKFGHMRRSGQSKNDLTRDQIFAIIEGHMLPHIYDCIQKHHPDDGILKQRYQEMKMRSQKELGIQAYYTDPGLFPYHAAVLKLRELSLMKLPTQKLRTIIQASQCALKRMGELSADTDLVAGADEFIDVWVYITLQAAVPCLYWDIRYLREFSNPNYMLSETGYYLSSLEMAAEYIKSLSLDATDDGCEHIQFVLLPDIKGLRKLCGAKSSPFSIHDDQFVLRGYKFATALEMARDSSRIIRFALMPVSSHNHRINLLKIKISEWCTTELLQKYLQLNFFSDVVLKNTKHGFVPLVSQSLLEDEKKVIFYFQNVVEAWPHIQNYVTLKYLGMGDVNFHSQYVNTTELEQKNLGTIKRNKKQFESYKPDLHDMMDLTSCLREIVIEIQKRLTVLKQYSTLLPKDGMYSLVLCRALQRFQQNLNKQIDRCDGVCDSNTFHRLKEMTIDKYANV